MPREFSQDLDAITIKANVKDAQGGVTTVQNPVWSTSDNNLVTVLDTSSDGQQVRLQHTSRTNSGPFQLRLDGDADLGEGVVPISHVEDFVVVPGKGASIEFEIV